MLHHIKYILLKLKLLQPSKKDIEKWTQEGYVLWIEYALKDGNYKTRKMAAEALGNLGYECSIPILFNTIEDKVQNVSIAALNALDKMNCNVELSSSIIKKRFNWVKKNREREAKFEANKGKKYTIYRWERTSKKSFELVKERLKKPIR